MSIDSRFHNNEDRVPARLDSNYSDYQNHSAICESIIRDAPSSQRPVNLLLHAYVEVLSDVPAVDAGGQSRNANPGPCRRAR